ncbi:MAG TPA: hypothetical protein ENH15_04220 [Actinobacteria bacterium]|nr:hypothetical protein [Actinomycetota bacterium]
MLSSIHPFGERSRNNRYALTVLAYVIGSVVGGALSGAAFGAIGSAAVSVIGPATTPILVMGGIVAAAGIMFDMGVGGLRLPTLHRQVNEDWLTTYRSWVYGAGWGFQLGFGLMTIVPSASIYTMFVLIVLNGSIVGGIIVGSFFGLARSSMIFTMARVDSPERLRSAHRTLQRRRVGGHRAALGGLGAASLILAGGALWP